MKFHEFGFILFVERYEECVIFYRDILQLKVRNVKDTLVCFDLPHGYLMVEQGGTGENQEKTREQNPTVLRFDVDSLLPVVKQLEDRGVRFTKKNIKFSWGTISVFHDPDGNRIELGEINNTSGSYVNCRG